MAVPPSDDARRIAAAGVRAADAGVLTSRAFDSDVVHGHLAGTSAVRVVAAGKAAVPMWDAAVARLPPVAGLVIVGPELPAPTVVPPEVCALRGGHPFPDANSIAAGDAARALARTVGTRERLVLLVSGGASALLARPAPGITLEDKILATRALMQAGANIFEVNAVRTHLSEIKGGGLARAAHGRCLTLALSDVTGEHEDDLGVIGSGPGMPTRATFADALAVVERYRPGASVPRAVVRRLEDGAAGRIAEPGSDDGGDEAPAGVVIGGRRDAMRGSAAEAARLGYDVRIVDAAVTGEARDAARRFVEEAIAWCRGRARACVIASGETTVTVRGLGRGGRNQEFALAAVPLLAGECRGVAIASIGTDGIDGPTDAAGGVVDHLTAARARDHGLSIEEALAGNDAYPYLAALDSLVITGPTGTNVGDLVVLTAEG